MSFTPVNAEIGDEPFANQSSFPTTYEYWIFGQSTPGTTSSDRAYWGANIDAISVEYDGSGVVVGIDDGTGFNNQHPDLSGQFDTGQGDSSMYFGSSPQVGTHGTEVAGVIAGRIDNDAGIAGGASGVTLVGFGNAGSDIRHTVGGVLVSTLIDVDVSNNSWGNARNNFDESNNHMSFLVDDGVDGGRGGLGTVVVFAAGNNRADNGGLVGVGDTNLSIYTNTPYVITVGATAEDGQHASFTTPGASILVAAPGVNDYTTYYTGSAYSYAQFSGTSFASPIVAATVALMLEANPGLGYRDVQEILLETARKNDASSGSWDTNNDALTWNNAPHPFSHDYGAGLVDARAAVKMAESWSLVNFSAGTYDSMDTLDYTVTVSNSTLNNNTASNSYTVSGQSDFRIQWVSVDVDVSHTDVRELNVTLTAPSGVVSTLMPNLNGSWSTAFNHGLDKTFSATHDWGENPNGTWTISIHDNAGGQTGSINAESIHFYGDYTSSCDDYYFTDEFTATGTTLTDTNGGGADTVNAAAVTGVVHFDMSTQSYSINGHSFSLSSAGIIEYVVGGTDDDYLIGDSDGNILVGGDGDDVVDGASGVDSMYGGKGNDVYSVDSIYDGIFENANEGNDIINSVIDYTCPSNFESIVLYGTGNINAAGNAEDNALVGNSANNGLDGGGGADYMVGLAGDDNYTVAQAGDTVVEAANEGNDLVYSSINYTLTANVESLVLTGSSNIAGSGNSADNAIIGNSGNNVINGKGGNDYLIGNGGNDTFVFAKGEMSSDEITDFNGNGASAGDSLQFSGFGAGSTLVQDNSVGWHVHDGVDGSNHYFHFSTAVSVDASDYSFV